MTKRSSTSITKKSSSARTGAGGKKNVRWNGTPGLKDHRREAILRSVATVLQGSRSSSLTINDIADELGMTKGNLYYYFKDKQDILFHCHMRSMEISLRALDDALAIGRTPVERLRILLISHIRGIIEDGFGGILQTDLEKIRPEQRKRYIRKRDQFESGVRDLIAAGVSAGEFECNNVKLAGFAILGGINWIPKWYNPNGQFSSEKISKEMADYFLRGLRPGAITAGDGAESGGTEDLASNGKRGLAETGVWK